MKKMLAALVVAVTLALGACATTADTPSQKVFAATQVYNTALTAAVTYKKLPSCESASQPCSDKSVVATLQKADTVAYEALKSAQTVVRNPQSSSSSLQAAALWAQEAASAFGRVANSLSRK